jgi:hypothetical protein
VQEREEVSFQDQEITEDWTLSQPLSISVECHVTVNYTSISAWYQKSCCKPGVWSGNQRRQGEGGGVWKEARECSKRGWAWEVFIHAKEKLTQALEGRETRGSDWLPSLHKRRALTETLE